MGKSAVEVEVEATHMMGIESKSVAVAWAESCASVVMAMVSMRVRAVSNCGRVK